METSSDIKELAEALSVAQGEMKALVKDAQNPYFKSSYATLSAVWDVCRAPFAKNGLSVVQTTNCEEGGKYFLLTRILHKSGQWVEGKYPLTPKALDPQSMAAGITYARRYSLLMMASLAPEDDDGNEATRPPSVSNDGTFARVIEKPQETIKPAADSANFVIQVGKKYLGKTLKEVPVAELTEFVGWIEDHIGQKSGPLRQQWEEFLVNANAYLAKQAMGTEDIGF